ncbi:hypothetical protein ACJ72_00289 [Emergomyces africanus]|uniref:Protein kinase domain-containing protein n=1 Tax=Emergomyces africanus TaxID=1955775 RepID=A0A1B7P8G9_9EURO|nr:hypothetical protein ACJ72_00289 [Emergomyces africanus]
MSSYHRFSYCNTWTAICGLYRTLHRYPGLSSKTLQEQFFRHFRLFTAKDTYIQVSVYGIFVYDFHLANLLLDVKPDNILVNNNRDPNSFSEVVLGDYGDTYRMDTTADPYEDGHIIGAAIFRSPEAMFNLRWARLRISGLFGVALISLIWGKGWHIFKLKGVDPADDAYPVRILMNHVNFFGPFPAKFNEKPFAQAEDDVLSVEIRTFLCSILKLDPRDRPTASELLDNEWFNEA